MIFLIFMQRKRKNILYHALRVISFFYCDFHPHVRFTQHKKGVANKYIIGVANKYIRYCLQSRKVCCLCFSKGNKLVKLVNHSPQPCYI